MSTPPQVSGGRADESACRPGSVPCDFVTCYYFPNTCPDLAFHWSTLVIVSHFRLLSPGTETEQPERGPSGFLTARPLRPCGDVVSPPVVDARNLSRGRRERLDLLRTGRSLAPLIHGVHRHAKQGGNVADRNRNGALS